MAKRFSSHALQKTTIDINTNTNTTKLMLCDQKPRNSHHRSRTKELHLCERFQFHLPPTYPSISFACFLSFPFLFSFTLPSLFQCTHQSIWFWLSHRRGISPSFFCLIFFFFRLSFVVSWGGETSRTMCIHECISKNNGSLSRICLQYSESSKYKHEIH